MEDKTYLQVVQYIKNEVKEDRLRVGNKLPTEREMSANLGFSRNSIREALRTLSSLGIIESRQGSGNYLSGDISRFFIEAFEMMSLVNKIKPIDISQMRRALEIQAFTQIVYSINQEQINKLKETLDLLSKSEKSEDDNSRLDLQFHLQLIELGGNTLLTCTGKALSNSFQENVLNNLKQLSPKQKEFISKAHFDIVVALEKHDLQAGLHAIHTHYNIVDDRIYGSGL